MCPDGGRVVTSAARRAQAQSPFTPFVRDLPVAPVLAPVRSERGLDVYEMEIREGLAEILPGFQTPIYGYDGSHPGPTIRAREGRTASCASATRCRSTPACTSTAAPCQRRCEVHPDAMIGEVVVATVPPPRRRRR